MDTIGMHVGGGGGEVVGQEWASGGEYYRALAGYYQSLREYNARVRCGSEVGLECGGISACGADGAASVLPPYWYGGSVEGCGSAVGSFGRGEARTGVDSVFVAKGGVPFGGDRLLVEGGCEGATTGDCGRVVSPGVCGAGSTSVVTDGAGGVVVDGTRVGTSEEDAIGRVESGAVAGGLSGVKVMEAGHGVELRQVRLPRGPNYARNQAARARKVKKRQAGHSGAGAHAESVCTVEDVELKSSLRDKWLAENALATAKAQKSLAVVKARDVDQQAKAERARALRRTETDLVAVEKAHGQLRATGNVPGVQGLSAAGTVETVISSGSISPNSSASLADLHKSLKRVSDLESMLLRNGLDPFADGKPKDLWTVGSDGEIVHKDAADEFYGDYAMLPLEIDGKNVVQIVTGF